jgi:hypothetical protein
MDDFYDFGNNTGLFKFVGGGRVLFGGLGDVLSVHYVALMIPIALSPGANNIVGAWDKVKRKIRVLRPFVWGAANKIAFG